LSFYYLAIAFNVWMIVDAVRRRAEFYWFLIILFVPLGSLVYFFMVKIHDFGFVKQRLTAGQRDAPLHELRRRAIETPSVQNKLLLANRLEADREYLDGAALFREILRQDANNKQALHGLARCLLGLNRPREAAEELAKLMELDSGFRDYSAALDYAEALWQSDQKEDAVGLLRGLVGVAPRMNHRVALAHYVSLLEGPTAARTELDQALSDYEQSPAYVKNRDKKWAERAHKMLRELG
jgi:hypothetical protein